MAKNITARVRYRLAATAFAVAGGLWCLGAMFGRHAMALLVIGMMNLAASMLLMSLRPPKGAVRETTSRTSDRSSRGTQTAELTLRTIPMDGTSTEETKPAVEIATDVGVARPHERKSTTWSI